jgi:hypothetical protein
VTFDCADYTRWEVTLEDNGELHGEWYRIHDPKERAPSCLERVSQ